MALGYEVLAKHFATVPVNLYGVYRTTLEPNLVYSGHMIEPTTKCALVLPLEGQASFIFDEEERCELAPGNLLIGGAGRKLKIETGPSGFQYGIAHYLPVETEERPAAALRPSDVALLETPPDPELLRLLERLLQASSEPDDMAELEKKSLFYLLLAKVLRAERCRRNQDSYSIIEDAMQYIHGHYMEPLTLPGLAKRYQMKPKYFSYLFQKYTGTGPIDYMIRYRMNRAYEWLLIRRYSVSAVARSVGYADPYYFSRVFKKYKGVAPSQVGFSSERNRPL